MPGDGDVVIAGIVDTRVAIFVDGDLNSAGSRSQRVEIGRGIEVVMEIDGPHVMGCKSAILSLYEQAVA
jgi:hypothetical protein